MMRPSSPDRDSAPTEGAEVETRGTTTTLTGTGFSAFVALSVILGDTRYRASIEAEQVLFRSRTARPVNLQDLPF